MWNPVSQRDWDDAHLINARGVHADDPEFGYRLISDELADAGREPLPHCGLAAALGDLSLA